MTNRNGCETVSINLSILRNSGEISWLLLGEIILCWNQVSPVVLFVISSSVNPGVDDATNSGDSLSGAWLPNVTVALAGGIH